MRRLQKEVPRSEGLLISSTNTSYMYVPQTRKSHLEEGDERQLRRGRVAPRVGHEPRAAHLLPRQLGQPVDGLRLQGGGLVLAAVPL